MVEIETIKSLMLPNVTCCGTCGMLGIFGGIGMSIGFFVLYKIIPWLDGWLSLVRSWTKFKRQDKREKERNAKTHSLAAKDIKDRYQR